MPANAPPGQNGPVDAPLYFASAVLSDGRVFVAGGEYNANPNVDILACSDLRSGGRFLDQHRDAAGLDEYR
jgi:hypothetical protein